MAKEKQSVIDKQLLQNCLVKLERLNIFTCEICNTVYCDKESLTSHQAKHVKSEGTDINEESTSIYNQNRRNPGAPCKTSHRKMSKNIVSNSKTQQKSIRDRIMFESDDDDIDDTFPKTEASDDESFVSEGDTLSTNEYQLFFDSNCDVTEHTMIAEETVSNSSREVEEDHRTLDISSKENEASKHILTKSYGKLIPCNICNKLVAHESSLKIHKLTHTNTRDADDSQGRQIQQVDCQDKQIQQVDCQDKQIQQVDCQDKQIQQVDCQDKQIQQVDCQDKQIQEVDVRDKQIQQVDVENKQTQKVGLHACDICQKAFSKRNYLTKHKYIHNLQKSWKCKFCGDAFKFEVEMQRHQRIHTNVKPYSCNICNIFFRNYSSLSYHRRIVHTKERPICGTCGKKCFDKSGLLRHILAIHMTTGYPCSICKKEFGHPMARASHMIVHKGTHKCSCGKSFSVKSDLKYHEETHKKAFECHYCNMRFGRKGHVERHIKNSCKKAPHLQKKPFECKNCHIKIQRREYLMVHIEICKLRPYYCSKCRIRYAEKSDLINHQNRCHKLKKNMANK